MTMSPAGIYANDPLRRAGAALLPPAWRKLPICTLNMSVQATSAACCVAANVAAKKSMHYAGNVAAAGVLSGALSSPAVPAAVSAGMCGVAAACAVSAACHPEQ
jgi:hypothetical protein